MTLSSFQPLHQFGSNRRIPISNLFSDFTSLDRTVLDDTLLSTLFLLLSSCFLCSCRLDSNMCKLVTLRLAVFRSCFYNIAIRVPVSTSSCSRFLFRTVFLDFSTGAGLGAIIYIQAFHLLLSDFGMTSCIHLSSKI